MWLFLSILSWTARTPARTCPPTTTRRTSSRRRPAAPSHPTPPYLFTGTLFYLPSCLVLFAQYYFCLSLADLIKVSLLLADLFYNCLSLLLHCVLVSWTPNIEHIFIFTWEMVSRIELRTSQHSRLNICVQRVQESCFLGYVLYLEFVRLYWSFLMVIMFIFIWMFSISIFCMNFSLPTNCTSRICIYTFFSVTISYNQIINS